MTMTEDDLQGGSAEASSEARAVVAELAEAGLLDRVMQGAEAGELTLTGEGGFLPEMVKAVLERGLAASSARCSTSRTCSCHIRNVTSMTPAEMSHPAA
jgi:hypothetical protein